MRGCLKFMHCFLENLQCTQEIFPAPVVKCCTFNLGQDGGANSEPWAEERVQGQYQWYRELGEAQFIDADDVKESFAVAALQLAWYSVSIMRNHSGNYLLYVARLLATRFEMTREHKMLTLSWISFLVVFDTITWLIYS